MSAEINDWTYSIASHSLSKSMSVSTWYLILKQRGTNHSIAEPISLAELKQTYIHWKKQKIEKSQGVNRLPIEMYKNSMMKIVGIHDFEPFNQ